MKPVDATLRTGSVVAMLAIFATLPGCYYVPYAYYPGYGYYPAYPSDHAAGYASAEASQQVPAAPAFTMPDGTSPGGSAPAYDFAPPAPAYGAAYYPVAVPPYPYVYSYASYPYPYPYYGYWPGYWWPSVSLAFWGGCCGGYYHYGHHAYWPGHGYWGHGYGGHGYWGHGYYGHGYYGHPYAGGHPYGGGWGGAHPNYGGAGWGGGHLWSTGGGRHGR